MADWLQSDWATSDWVASIPAFVMISIAIVVVWVKRRRRRAREEKTRVLAESRGWRWQREDPGLTKCWELSPFGTGHRPQARNVVRGEHRGWDFVAFEYQYTTNRGRSGRRRQIVAYAITLPVALPTIEAGPESVFGGRVARAFGRGGVRTGDEDLDTLWRFEAEDEELARALLHDRMRRLLRETGAWCWGFEGTTMLSHHEGQLDVANDLLPRLDLMATVLGQVPDHLWRTAGSSERPDSSGV